MKDRVLRKLLDLRDAAPVEEIMETFSSGAFYSKGIDINTALRDNNTTLHFATKFGHVSLIKELLNHTQIKCDIQNDLGETPFHVAAMTKRGNPDILNLLLQKSPGTINDQNKNGKTPLHYAILTENIANTIALLDNNADTKLTDHQGDGSLHAAVLMGNTRLIQLIIQKDPTTLFIENHKGMSPLDLACSLGHTDVVNLLLMSYQSIDIKQLLKAATFAVKYGHLEVLKELSFFPAMSGSLLFEDKAALTALCTLAAQHGNYSMIKYINSLDETIVEAVPAAKQFCADKKSDEIEKIAVLMNMSVQKNTETIPSLQEYFPLLNTEAAAILLVDKKEKMDIDTPTVILNGSQQLDTFLAALSETALDETASLYVQFAIAEPHWRCGVIAIDKGKVEICYIDPTGEKGFGSYLEKDLRKIGQTFPTATIFVSTEKRQRDYSSCSVFTLDDMLHLLNAARYLPAQYAEDGIFAYLRDHVIKTSALPGEDSDKGLLHFVTLPLRFIRTMQSLKSTAKSPDSFFYDAGIYPRLEQTSSNESKLPVNKRWLTTEESIQEHIQVVNGSEINKRIGYKLDRMREALISYMHTHSQEQIDQAKVSTSLKGFLNSLPELIVKNKGYVAKISPGQPSSLQ